MWYANYSVSIGDGKVEFKKIMLILTITVSILIISLMGVSYAWYSLSNSFTSFNTTTGDADLSIVYAQSEYVNMTTGVPISESDVPTKAGISRFTVTPENNLNGYSVFMSIELSQISIAQELKTSDFKIQLLENGSPIFNCTGADINGNSLVMKQLSNITVGTTYTYELRIWINDTGVSQNELMGKSFSGKIKISSSIKK